MDTNSNNNGQGNKHKSANYSEILTRGNRTRTTLKISRTTKPAPTRVVITSQENGTSAPPTTISDKKVKPTRPTRHRTTVRPTKVPTIRSTGKAADNTDGVPLEIYVGAAVGCAVLICLLIIIIVCCVKRRRKKALVKRSKPSHETSTNGTAVLYRIPSTSSENVLLVSEYPERTSNQFLATDRGIVNKARTPSPLLIPNNGRKSKSSQHKIRNGSNTDSLSPSTPETTAGNVHKFQSPTLEDDVFSDVATPENESPYENGYVLPDFKGLTQKGVALANPILKSQTLGTDRPQPEKVAGETETRRSLKQLKWVHTPPVIHGPPVIDGVKAHEASPYIPMDPILKSLTNAGNPLFKTDPGRKTSLPARHFAEPPKACRSSGTSSYVNMNHKKMSCPTLIPDDSQLPYYEAIFLTPEKTSTPAPKMADDTKPQEEEASENYENIGSVSTRIEKHHSDLEKRDERTFSLYATPDETTGSRSGDDTTDSVYDTPKQTPTLDKWEDTRTDSLYETPPQTPDLNGRETKLTDSLYHTPRQTPELDKGATKLTNSLYYNLKQTSELNKGRSGNNHKDVDNLNRQEEEEGEEEGHIYPNVTVRPTIMQDSQENSSMMANDTLEDLNDYVNGEGLGENDSTSSAGNNEDDGSDTDNVYDIPSSSRQDLPTESTPEGYRSNGQAKKKSARKSTERCSSQTENFKTANVYENTVSMSLDSGQSRLTAEENPRASATYVKQSYNTYANESPFNPSTHDSDKNSVYEVPGSVFEVDPIPLNSAQNSPMSNRDRNSNNDRYSSSRNEDNMPDVGNEERVMSAMEEPDVDTENVYDIPQNFTEEARKDEKRVKAKPATAPKPKIKTSAAQNLDQSGSKFLATPISPQPSQNQINVLESIVDKAKATTSREIGSSKVDDKSQMQNNSRKTWPRGPGQSNSSENPSRSSNSESDKASRKRGNDNQAAKADILENDDDDDDSDDDDDDDDSKGHSYVNIKDAVWQADPRVMPSGSPDRHSDGMNLNKSPSRGISRLQSVDGDKKNDDISLTESPTSSIESPVSKAKKTLFVGIGNSTSSSGKFDMRELQMALRGVRERKS